MDDIRPELRVEIFSISIIRWRRVRPKLWQSDLHSQSHVRPLHGMINKKRGRLRLLWPALERSTSGRITDMLEKDHWKEEVACSLSARGGPLKQTGNFGSRDDHGT